MFAVCAWTQIAVSTRTDVHELSNFAESFQKFKCSVLSDEDKEEEEDCDLDSGSASETEDHEEELSRQRVKRRRNC